MPIENEKQIIEQAKADPQYFELLYTAYYGPIMKFVYARIESFDDCKEVVSVIFTKALTNISQYKNLGFPFSSWLYRIAVNEVNQFYRQSKKARAICVDEKGISKIAQETETEKRELLDNLKMALDYLSEEELLLIELRYFEERPFAEVAEILGITENNSKVKTYRILDKLRKAFYKIS